jgi:hypothetical protein
VQNLDTVVEMSNKNPAIICVFYLHSTAYGNSCLCFQNGNEIAFKKVKKSL